MNRQEAREQFGHAMFLVGGVSIIAEEIRLVPADMLPVYDARAEEAAG